MPNLILLPLGVKQPYSIGHQVGTHEAPLGQGTAHHSTRTGPGSSSLAVTRLGTKGVLGKSPVPTAVSSDPALRWQGGLYPLSSCMQHLARG